MFIYKRDSELSICELEVKYGSKSIIINTRDGLGVVDNPFYGKKVLCPNCKPVVKKQCYCCGRKDE
jgi:hypothetical protein